MSSLGESLRNAAPWVLLALALGTRPRGVAPSTASSGHPGGRPEDEDPTTTTSPATVDEWIATRLAVLRTLVPEFFPNADAWTREELARAFLTLFYRETGGTNERNNNPGNLTLWGSQSGRWHVLPNRSLHYRSFPTLEDGVRDFLRVITSPRYASATAMLARTPTAVVGWYEDIASRGYSEHTPEKLAEIRREATNLRQRIETWSRAHAAQPGATA